MTARYIFTMEDNLDMQMVRDLYWDNALDFDEFFPYATFIAPGTEWDEGAKIQAVFDCMSQAKKLYGGMFFKCYDTVTEQYKSYYSGTFAEGNLKLIVGGMYKDRTGTQAGYRFSEEYCRDRYNYYVENSIESQTMIAKKPSKVYDHLLLSISNDDLYRTFNRYEEKELKNDHVEVTFYW